MANVKSDTKSHTFHIRISEEDLRRVIKVSEHYGDIGISAVVRMLVKREYDKLS